MQGAVSIIFRGSDNQQEQEEKYVDKFSNPFPAAVRGRPSLSLSLSLSLFLSLSLSVLAHTQ